MRLNQIKKLICMLKNINCKHYSVLLIGIADSIVSTAKTYVPLFLLAPFLQAVIDQKRPDTITMGISYFLAISLCNIASQWVQGKRIIAARKMNENTIDSLYQKISRLKYKDVQSGELKTKYSNAIEVLYYEFDYSDLIDCEVNLFSSFLHIIFSLSITFALICAAPSSGYGIQYILARTDLALVSTLVLLTVLILFKTKTAGRMTAKQAEFIQEHADTEQKLMCLQNNIIFEFKNYLTYHLFHMKDMLASRFNENAENNTRFFSNIRNISLFSQTCSGAAAGIAAIYSYALTIAKSLAGAIPISAIVTYAQSMIKMYEAIIETLSLYGKIERVIPYINNIDEVMQSEEESQTGKTANAPKKVDTIQFEHVYYRYPNSQKYALEDINLTLKRGRHVLVGENGSGKTTLLLLLCRILEPERGRILINGTDIQEYELNTYRHLFSYMFQDSGLYPIPLGENIACNLDYDIKNVQAAMHKIEISENLCSEEALSAKAASLSLSGGERQKIIAARSLYRNADVWVCDEPTAAMDAVSEDKFYRLLKRMQKEKFVIFVSHRMSCCQDCEDIIVFHAGKISERGNHPTLKNKKGMYDKLWSIQALHYNQEILKEEMENV